MDKIYHMIAGFVLATLWIAIGFFHYGIEYSTLASQSIALTFVVGIGKEIYDYVSSRFFGIPHTVEVQDVFATVVGSLPYFGIGILIGLK